MADDKDNNDIEIWKNMNGIYSHYKISSHGNITNTITGTVLSTKTPGNHGYCTVTLTSKNMKPKNKPVHRLVAENFCENNDPVHNTLVDHIDRNPLNNLASNLRWVTPEQNSNNRTPAKTTNGGCKIHLFSIDGNFIKEYKSSEEAQLDTSCDNSRIIEMCKMYRAIEKGESFYIPPPIKKIHIFKYAPIQEESDEIWKSLIVKDKVKINDKKTIDVEVEILVSNYGKVQKNGVLLNGSDASGSIEYSVLSTKTEKINKNGKIIPHNTKRRAHRLVAAAFKNLDLDDVTKKVSHTNNNKLDNHIDNLEILDEKGLAKKTGKIRGISILQLDGNTREIIKKFNSKEETIRELFNTTNTRKITQCLDSYGTSDEFLYNGFYFKYDNNSNIKKKYIPPNSKKILQLDMTNKKTGLQFNSKNEAMTKLKITEHMLNNILENKTLHNNFYYMLEPRYNTIFVINPQLRLLQEQIKYLIDGHTEMTQKIEKIKLLISME